MRRLLVFAGLVGCSDYGLNEEVRPPEVHPPEIVVEPGELALSGLCEPEVRELLIRNRGEGTLVVKTLELEGSGWELTSTPPLPLTLKAGESTVVRVEGESGEATLVIGSDDPEHPSLEVPLSATQNTPPVVTILTPGAQEVLAEGVDYSLTGTAVDAEDLAENLTIEWRGSVDGLVAGGAPAADGTTEAVWAATARSGGPQSISLTATDSCGATATTSTELCQEGANTYDALSLSAWHYEGSAAWDSSAANLQLTAAVTDEVGSAFETSTPVNADNVDIQFYVFIGGGTGADGLSLTALDVARATSFLGGSGCGIGYGGSADCTDGPALPGWSLEIDTYYNGGVDPTGEDHLAFTFDGDVDAYQAWATLPEMEDTGWHYVEVSVVAPHVRVAIDGVVYLDQDIPGNYGFSAYVGFTAGTGGETNEHRIDELTVTDYSCD